MWGSTGGRRGSGTAGPLRRTRAVAGSAVAAVAALSGATLASADTLAASTGAPQQASPHQVAAALGANRIPEAIVVLVDTSSSMSGRHNGLYPQVKRELPRFLAAFAKQEPGNEAAVVTFGPRSDTIIRKPLSRPAGSIDLPADATDEGTDVGNAFKVALNILGNARQRFPAGGVLLLSDGRVRTHDAAYRTFQSSGWQQLHTTVAGLLPMQVAGYGLPLTTNRRDLTDQSNALQAVFRSNWLTLTPNTSDLSSELAVAQADLLKQRVRAAAKHDSGQGVHVTWDSMPGYHGAGPLDLTSGHGQVQVTLRAATKRVPLYVTGFSVAGTGLGAHVTGRLPASSELIRPGESVPLTVQLTWPKMPRPADGGTPRWCGQLALSGQVRSTFSNALTNYYGYKTFSAGPLRGGSLIPVCAGILPPRNFTGPILLLVAVLLLLAVAAAYLSRLNGTLILTTVDDVSNGVRLPRLRPWLSANTGSLIGIPGKLTVRGLPFPRRMRIRVKLDRRPEATGPLREGGRTMLAGIDITHDPDAARAGAGYGGGGPDGP